METYTFIKGYKQNDMYRESFNDLAKQTFQIDFEPWYQQGFWNDRYMCYSYLYGEKIIANVSISKMQMVIKGEVKQAIQIGTVMTHPDYRRKGLAGNLLTKVLNEYENEADIFFLFAGEQVSGFYQQFGFIEKQEFRFSLGVKTSKHLTKPQNLRPELDKQMILDYYSKKISSCKFDIEKGEHVVGFYTLNGFGNDFYYVNELDAIVFFRIVNGQLHLYGVFSDKEFSFEDVLKHITDESVHEVVFHYTPQWSDLQATIKPIFTTDDIFHIRSKVDLPTRFKFPLLAHA